MRIKKRTIFMSSRISRHLTAVRSYLRCPLIQTHVADLLSWDAVCLNEISESGILPNIKVDWMYEYTLVHDQAANTIWLNDMISVWLTAARLLLRALALTENCSDWSKW
jgi:hypothetical protein